MDTRMNKNTGVKVRTGIMDTLSNKPCRKCNTLMDDAGTHYICLACGYKLEKTESAGSTRESTAWEKQVADLRSQQQLSARQASGIQLMAGFGPLRTILFLLIAVLCIAGPLQNLAPLVNGLNTGPLALPTAVFFLFVLSSAGWSCFSQPGLRRTAQRNLLAVLALACLAGLIMSGPVNAILASQYGAMQNVVSHEIGVANRIAATPALWTAPLLFGTMFSALAVLALICHREADESAY